jgi:hypothetical protein
MLHFAFDFIFGIGGSLLNPCSLAADVNTEQGARLFILGVIQTCLPRVANHLKGKALQRFPAPPAKKAFHTFDLTDVTTRLLVLN